MLEILMLIFLTRKVGEIVGAKGRKAGWYKFMTVLLWFGCEVVGAIIGIPLIVVGLLALVAGIVSGSGGVPFAILFGAGGGTHAAGRWLRAGPARRPSSKVRATSAIGSPVSRRLPG